MAREECDRSSPIDRFEPINAREKNPTTFSRLCARDMRFMMANLDGHFSLSLFSFSRSCPVHDIYLILDVYGYIEQKIVRVTAAIWINISHARDGINDRLWRCFNFNDIRRSIDWKEGKVVVEGHDGKSMFPGGMKPCHEECQTHDNREENGFAFLPHFDIYLVEFLLKEQRTFFFTEIRDDYMYSWKRIAPILGVFASNLKSTRLKRRFYTLIFGDTTVQIIDGLIKRRRIVGVSLINASYA